MKFAILATAIALCGLSTAYEVKEGGFKVAVTDESGSTITWEVPIFDITRFEGDTAQKIGRQIFGSDNVYNGNIKVELISGPQPAYCRLHHYTGTTVSWETTIPIQEPLTNSEPFTGQVTNFGGIECYKGLPPNLSSSTGVGSRQVASTFRISRFAGSYFS